MSLQEVRTAEQVTKLSESQRAVLQKYLLGEERSWEDVCRRVARFVASAEKTDQLRAEWEEKFFSVLAPMKMVPGGSILANAEHGTFGLLNCFVLSAEDHIQDIASLVTDAILTTKFRGGVGVNIGSKGQKGYIRPKGSPFADGKALGPCAVLDMISETSKKITTGNKARRGAFLFSMHWKHPDIWEFIQAKTQSVIDASAAKTLIQEALALAADTGSARHKQERLAEIQKDLATAWTETHLSAGGKRDRRWHNANISVQVDEEFFECLDQGDTLAVKLWDKIAQFAHDTADPGLLFIDNAKRRSPIRDYIVCTNPCVTADTWVHTGEGPRQVRDLIGIQHSTYVNGELFSTTGRGFFSTGVKPVLVLQTAEGYRLRLTGNHRVLKVTAQTHKRQYTEWVAVEDLSPGDKVMIHDHRGLQPWDGPGTSEQGWLLGMLIGDGSIATVRGEDIAVLHFGDESAEHMLTYAALLVNEYAPPGRKVSGYWHGQSNRYVIGSSGISALARTFGITRRRKHNLERIEQGSFDFYTGFLRGLFDADGVVRGNRHRGVSVRLAQGNVLLLEAVQRMLLRIGIAATVGPLKRAHGPRLVRPYRPLHELVITGDNLTTFHQLIGFQHPEKAARLQTLTCASACAPQRERFCVSVESVKPDGTEEVYDCTVPGPARFDANGLVAHNCGEIYLPPNSACNLGSLCIPRFIRQTPDGAQIDWDDLGRTVEISVRFLDNVLDISEFATPAQKHNVRNVYRQLGLGIMGWADWLKLRRLPYDSEAHLQEIDRVGGFIAGQAYRASEALAAEKGACGIWPDIQDVRTGNPFEMWRDAAGNTISGDQALHADEGVYQMPRRNSTVLSIAPTGSIAQLAACSWAFEPDFGLTIWKQVYVDASSSEQNWVQILNPYIEDLALSDADKQAVLQTGTLAGTRFAEENPEVAAAFRISREIPWQWHVFAQSRWQAWVDSSISKTVNCSRDTGVEEIKEIYRFAERNGLKGITVYREGTLDSEPVKVGALDEVEAPKAVLFAHNVSKDRASSLLHGFSRRFVSRGYGDIFVSVHYDTEGPREVWINAGKSGEDVHATGEALGRLASLLLHYGVPTGEIGAQLRGIRGSELEVTEAGVVLSLADALGRVLEEAPPFLNPSVPNGVTNGNGKSPEPEEFSAASSSDAHPAMLDEEITQTAQLLGIQYDEGPLYIAESTSIGGWTSRDFKGGCGGGVLHYQVWPREGGKRLLLVRSDSYSMCYIKG